VKPRRIHHRTDPFQEEPQPSFLTELLFPLPAVRRTTLGILTWWESRRLLYNIIVGATGIVTLGVIAVAELIAPPKGHSLFSESALIPVLIYGALANMCYTLGPIVEIALERTWKDLVLPIGPALFRQGLTFSIGLTLLPIPMVIFMEMARLVHFLFVRG
jgi:hypothetical protein